MWFASSFALNVELMTHFSPEDESTDQDATLALSRHGGEQGPLPDAEPHEQVFGWCRGSLVYLPLKYTAISGVRFGSCITVKLQYLYDSLGKGERQK